MEASLLIYNSGHGGKGDLQFFFVKCGIWVNNEYWLRRVCSESVTGMGLAPTQKTLATDVKLGLTCVNQCMNSDMA